MSLAFFLLYRFQGSRPEEQPNFPPGKRLRKRRRVERRGKGESPRTLTTAYEQRRDQERLVISVQYDERETHWARKIGLRRIDEKIKLRRAQGGCPGTIRRRRTRSAAKSCGEPQAGFEPWMSEWGNPAVVMRRHGYMNT